MNAEAKPAGAGPVERTVGRPAAGGDDFLRGICVSLQVISGFDCGVMWAELVRAVGVDDLLQYAAHIEPDEWQLAGFARYAMAELGRSRPRKRPNV